MFLSIVIPLYNVEKYLNECINSILKQTFTDFEIILVDDGSTDKSPEICDNFSKEYTNIKVIHKSNGGQADARNVGLKEAIGEYVLFIDSDDYIGDINFLSDIYNNIENNDIICYKFQKYFENTDRLAPCSFKIPDFTDDMDKASRIRTLSASDALYCAAWTKVIRRSILTENNIMFEVGCKCEDMKWYFDVLINAQTISGIDKSYIVYRQREGSITKSNALKTIADNTKVLEDINKKIKYDILDKKMQESFFYALSKLYCNLLISYAATNEKDKRQYHNRISQMSGLLDFHENSRSNIFYKINKYLGFGMLIFILKVLCKLR